MEKIYYKKYLKYKKKYMKLKLSQFGGKCEVESGIFAERKDSTKLFCDKLKQYGLDNDRIVVNSWKTAVGEIEHLPYPHSQYWNTFINNMYDNVSFKNNAEILNNSYKVYDHRIELEKPEYKKKLQELKDTLIATKLIYICDKTQKLIDHEHEKNEIIKKEFKLKYNLDDNLENKNKKKYESDYDSDDSPSNSFKKHTKLRHEDLEKKLKDREKQEKQEKQENQYLETTSFDFCIKKIKILLIDIEYEIIKIITKNFNTIDPTISFDVFYRNNTFSQFKTLYVDFLYKKEDPKNFIEKLDKFLRENTFYGYSDLIVNKFKELHKLINLKMVYDELIKVNQQPLYNLLIEPRFNAFYLIMSYINAIHEATSLEDVEKEINELYDKINKL